MSGPLAHVVSEADTATAMGSGDVPVLATPRLLAWLEAATVQAAAESLRAGQTSVGVAIRVNHRAATPVGGRIEVTAAAPRTADGRRLIFEVQAVDPAGRVVADGEVERVVVDRGRFLAGVAGASG